MTETAEIDELPDLREQVFAAQDWVSGLIDKIADDQWDAATPCADFDVTALVQHLYGVVGRLTVMGSGAPADSAPRTVTELPDDVGGDYRRRVAEARTAWADPVSLTRVIEVPWGQAPGAAVLGVYLAENLTHGWDLATAIGQPPEADPALVGPADAMMHRVLPPGGRDDFPYDAPVEPAVDAGPTERLANWTGRVSRP